MRLGQLALLADDGVREVEDRGPDERGDVLAGRALRGGDEQHAAIEDRAPQVDRGAGLTEDGARPLRGGVVGEPRLHGRERVGAVLAAPAPEVALPPVQQELVAHALQHEGAEAVVGEQAQPVEDRVLLLGGGGGVGVVLVQGLHDLLEDRLHARSPLLPEPLRHAHDRVGGAVAVGEDARVEQVDAGVAALAREVEQAYLPRQGLGDLLEDVGDEVGVGVDDDDRVAIAARRLLAQPVRDEVLHERRLAHARARDVEVVAAQQVVGEADLPRRARRRLADERPAAYVPRLGDEHPRPGARDERRLVLRPRRVPERHGLAHAEHAQAHRLRGRGRRPDAGARREDRRRRGGRRLGRVGLRPGPGPAAVSVLLGGVHVGMWASPHVSAACGNAARTRVEPILACSERIRNKSGTNPERFELSWNVAGTFCERLIAP